ncbi:MAG: sarcosine oxidase subunit gamma [Rhodobacteraceae bacterium]|nr:sarcosine oxidase subunit gamma [Paracoccaceae bacterium]
MTGLPLTIGTTTLSAFDPGPVASIAPYPGRDLSSALAPLRFPRPGEVVDDGNRRLIWAGRAMAFLTGGAAPDLAGLAAVTDQTDGWAWAKLEGRMASAVLARLCPLDLRPAAFPVGTSARSTLQHLPALLVRVGDEAFQLASFRSMAGTLVHEIAAAMKNVAARATH